MKSSKAYPEYSKLQKDRIVNSFLEFYKDGKNQYDENKKKQTQGYYNAKSEILKGLETWCEEDTFVKYIIPILDYNLETDQGALEDEWVKNHKLQCEKSDLSDENKRLRKGAEHHAQQLAKEMMAEWVTDKEDVMNLQNALDESEQRRIAQTRKQHIKMEGMSNKLENAQNASARLGDEIREYRTKQIEEELSRKEGSDDKSKLVKENEKLSEKVQRYSMKSDKNELQNEKNKMEVELLKMKLKTATDTVKANMVAEKEDDAALKAQVKKGRRDLTQMTEQMKMWKALAKAKDLGLDPELSPPPSP